MAPVQSKLVLSKNLHQTSLIPVLIIMLLIIMLPIIMYLLLIIMLLLTMLLLLIKQLLLIILNNFPIATVINHMLAMKLMDPWLNALMYSAHSIDGFTTSVWARKIIGKFQMYGTVCVVKLIKCLITYIL